MVLSGKPANRINRSNRVNLKSVEPYIPGKTNHRELPRLVEAARIAMEGYVHSMLTAYSRRCTWRRTNHIPVIALCGMGESGKDMSAAYLCSRTQMAYGGSTSSVVAPLIAHALNVDVETAFSQRRENRVFWYDFCCEFRRHDPTLLAKMNLAHGDIVVGPRDDIELFACRQQGVVDLSVWIERTAAAKDPTVKFGADDCDLVIPNNGSRFDLFRKWDVLLAVTGIGSKTRKPR